MNLLDNGSIDLDDEIPPGKEVPVYFAIKVKSPCKMSLVLKINVVYTNIHSRVEYTQELPPSPEFFIGYLPVQQQ